MSYAPTRSANHELLLGTTDGEYKSVVRDRGGQVEQGTWYSRDELDCCYYAIREAPTRSAPDGRKFVSPYYTETPCPDKHTNMSLSGVDYLEK